MLPPPLLSVPLSWANPFAAASAYRTALWGLCTGALTQQLLNHDRSFLYRFHPTVGLGSTPCTAHFGLNNGHLNVWLLRTHTLQARIQQMLAQRRRERRLASFLAARIRWNRVCVCVCVCVSSWLRCRRASADGKAHFIYLFIYSFIFIFLFSAPLGPASSAEHGQTKGRMPQTARAS